MGFNLETARPTSELTRRVGPEHRDGGEAIEDAGREDRLVLHEGDAPRSFLAATIGT